MNEDVAFINEQVDRHHAWFSKSLPMIASENVISPMAREMLLTDFGDRYAEGLPHERYYQGNVFVDEVEDRVVALAKKLFRVRHMDPRLISGTVANMAVYFALLEPGYIMTSVALSHGAHISSAKFGAAGMRGVNNVNYPFDIDPMNMDVDGTAKLIRLVKPTVAACWQRRLRELTLRVPPVRTLLGRLSRLQLVAARLSPPRAVNERPRGVALLHGKPRECPRPAGLRRRRVGRHGPPGGEPHHAQRR